MVEATVETRASAHRLERVSARTFLAVGSMLSDLVAILGAFLLVVAARDAGLVAASPPAFASASWWIVLFAVATGAAFYVAGLYDLEVYVSRPLHLWTLVRVSLVALAVSGPLFVILDTGARQHLELGLAAFVSFLVLSGVFRFFVLDRRYTAMVRRNGRVSLVVGDSEPAQRLTQRLGQLRGFDKVESVSAGSSAGGRQSLAGALQGHGATSVGAASVFIDGSSLTPREVYESAKVAQELGANVFVVSELIACLENNRLLRELFGVPIIRVRGGFGRVRTGAVKRAFDIVGSLLLLIVTLPVIAVLGILIRLESPGPVLYTQTRVGRDGRKFQFLKLRSMIVNHDASIHSEYVREFMNGTAHAVAVGTNGDSIFKKVDDPRITRIGKFMRKYSLDELPQFWNVLVGDMSLVGPRPPLPYEVSEYSEWDSLRLGVPTGVTGCWQVAGRSRVTFEEMILQDVMYAQNMRLLVDVGLCLKTVPAALFGGGGG